MNSEVVKGFSDYTGEEAIKREKIRKVIEETFNLYGFEPAETPIIENEEFVIGENKSDEAVSDRYKLEDRGKRKLALRYEFTFQLKRLAQNKKLPYKRYQICYVFRDEPISANRFRQFTQCDIDIIGSTLKDEAEVLKAFSDILKKLNIDAVIYINNRKLMNEILEDLKVDKNDREAVIREIDKMDKLSEKEVKENLKKYNAEKALEVFSKPESYFEKYPAYEEIKKKKIKETICGGGSYLVNGIQSTGISASLERLSVLANINLTSKSCLIISLDQDKKAVELSQTLRNNDVPCAIVYCKPSKALEYANSKSIQFVIFIGEDEVKSKKYKLKDMKSGKEFNLADKELVRK